MKLGNNKVLISVLALFILASAYGLYRLVRGRDIPMPDLFRTPAGERLLISMEGFRFSQSENGRVTWRMRTGSAELYENREARLRDIEIVFFGPGRGEAALLGETGTMDTESGDAVVRSGSRDVRIVTSDGYLLTTNSLSWRAGERTVRTADPFRLLGREIYLEGRGITANVDSRTVAVEENVKAVLQE